MAALKRTVRELIRSSLAVAMAWLWPGCGYGSCVVVNCTVRFGSLSEALLKSRTSPGLDILLDGHLWLGCGYGMAVAMASYYSHGLAITMAWVWLWPGCGLAFENWFMRRLCRLFGKLPVRLKEVVADFV